jgi:Protein of unknown function (DUF2959)
MLRDSKQRQAAYMTAMRKTESQLTPVLKSFQDQVLFLKHHLNARAIGSLKGTTARINTDVTALTKSIDNSIQDLSRRRTSSSLLSTLPIRLLINSSDGIPASSTLSCR